MDPIHVPPDLPAREGTAPVRVDGPEGGLSTEEMEMLISIEPLAGPLPLIDGGEILEPLTLPVPEARSLHKKRERGESFWSFGGDEVPVHRLDGWMGR